MGTGGGVLPSGGIGIARAQPLTYSPFLRPPGTPGLLHRPSAHLAPRTHTSGSQSRDLSLGISVSGSQSQDQSQDQSQGPIQQFQVQYSSFRVQYSSISQYISVITQFDGKSALHYRVLFVDVYPWPRGTMGERIHVSEGPECRHIP